MITAAQERTTETPPVISTVAALLRALGSRGDVVCTIDFECYYSKDFSLSKLTTEGYVRDPRFQVIGVGVKFGDGDPLWLEEWEFRRWARSVDWSRVAVNAHHAQLDAFILSHHYGIFPGFLYCTLTMGRALHGVGANSLKALAPVYGLGEKGDELAATKGKRREDFTQREWERFGVYCKQDVDLCAGLLGAMGEKTPPLELWLIDSTIRMFTEPQFLADEAVLIKARDNERERKRKLLTKIAGLMGVSTTAEARALLMSNEKFAAVLRILGEEPPTKKNPKGLNTYAFAKTDPGMQALLEHENDDIRDVAEARVGVKSTITETRAERIIGISRRGPVPFYLLAYGAHTGRWSGGDKMNPQNFNRGGELRDAILAPAGCLLAVADSAQIEARTIAWLAGEERLLELFRNNDAALRAGEAQAALDGVDLHDKKAAKAFWAARGGEPDFYASVGSAFFLKRVSKSETPLERQLSKNMVLGLGFGMGWAKFASELLKGMLGSDPVQFTVTEVQRFAVNVAEFAARQLRDGTKNEAKVRALQKTGVRLSYDALLIHCAVADHFVSVYRRANKAIPRLWKTCDEMLRVMTDEANDNGAARMSFMGLRVVRHAIILPSGRRLRYVGLRRAKDGYAYKGGEGGRKWVKLYGAKLTENIVQALARDVVAEQAMRIRAQGYHLGTTTHDEVVAVVPRADAAGCLRFMRAAMSVPSEWCSTLPLNATGDVGECYGSAK